MTVNKYIVLEKVIAGDSTFRSGETAGPSADGYQLRSEELDAAKLRALRKKPTVRVAPLCPMTLPTALGKPDEPGSRPKVAWGVAAVRAHESPYDGTGVTVALLDTGIDLLHPAFDAIRGRTVVRDFTGEGTHDNDGHGTHCAGTIFGGDVDGTRIGIARGVSRVLIGKVLGRGATTQTVTEAIEWACREGAHVISMSLALDFPRLQRVYQEDDYPSEVATSLALDGYRENVELFRDLFGYQMKGAAMRKSAVLFVAASGNESKRDKSEDYSVSAAPPAAAEGVTSVGAIERRADGQWAPATYSNAKVRVCAPGSKILSAGLGGGLVEMSGTSMAAPHVAGVAALWAQKRLETDRRLLMAPWQQDVERCTRDGFVVDAPYELIGNGLVQAPVD